MIKCIIAGIYSSDARVVQYSQINQCDTLLNRVRNKNHWIISIDEEKVFYKINIRDFFKKLNKVGTEGT